MKATTKTEIFAQMNNLDLDDLNGIYHLRDFIIQLGGFGNIGLGGDMFYVDPVNGDDSKDGLTPANAYKTLAVGYAALTTNANDILFFIGGASSLVLPTDFEWSKNYAHFIGLSSALHAGGRCRLTHSTDYTPLFLMSGSGCQFANIHIQHGRGNVANLVNMHVTGSRNSFYNVQLEGPLHVTEAAAAFRELVIAGGAEANSFYACNIGNWSIQATGTDGREIEFLGLAADCHFEKCTIRCLNDTAGHLMIDASAGLGSNNVLVEFDDCKFINVDNTAVITNIFEVPANGYFLLNRCVAVRSTNFSSDATKVLLANSVIA